MPADAPLAISRDDRFLRRVPHRVDYFEWHDDLGRWVPSLAGVRFDPDGLSAFVSRLLQQRGHGPAEVCTLGRTSEKAAVAYEFDVQVVADIGFAAAYSPNEDTPIGYAHASILKPTLAREDERQARTTLASRMALVHGIVEFSKPLGA